MNLAFRCPGADSAPADEIRDVLWRDHVQIFDSRRNPHLIQLDEKPPAGAQAFIDLKAAVEPRVIDKTFPANRRARFFEVDAHDDQKIGLKTFFFRFQISRIFECGFRVVNRTRTDNDEQTVVGAMQYAMDLVPGFVGDLSCPFGEREFVTDNLGRPEVP